MKIRNNEPRAISISGLIALAPGLNEVDADLWAKHTKPANPALTAMLTKQKGQQRACLEVLGGEATAKEAAPDVGDLSQYNADEAKELVSDCFDRATLNGWKKAEHDGKARKTVLEAIDQQLELTKA